MKFIYILKEKQFNKKVIPLINQVGKEWYFQD